MSQPEVVVIDYGVGNLLSVQRALEFCGASVVLTAEPKQILAAKHVVLPGVGAFANGMRALERLGLNNVIIELGLRKTPLLGICLGMQLLLEESEEFGITSGLGLIPGRVIPVPEFDIFGSKQKVPHIGWRGLVPGYSDEKWQYNYLQDVQAGDAVYFVHSFMASPTLTEHRIADVVYGGHKIAAMIRCDQITGCQFHPEKSGEIGLKILRRFIAE
jgi:glutamine amidotransferase